MEHLIRLVRNYALSGALILMALAVALSGLAITKAEDAIHRAAAVQAGRVTRVATAAAQAGNAAAQAQQLAQAIAASRAQAILAACNEQNSRHKHTVTELDRLLRNAKRHASRTRRAQIRATRAPTILLIDQLAPYQDCQQVLAESISTK